MRGEIEIFLYLFIWRSRDKYINQSVHSTRLSAPSLVRRCRLNILPDRSIAAQRSLLASRSLSRRARMSFFLTGPLTFLTKVLFTLPMKATLTCVIPPLEPVTQTNAPTLKSDQRKTKKPKEQSCLTTRVENERIAASFSEEPRHRGEQ